MESSISRVLIIGYGNPLRCDDGVGCLVASELESLFEDAIDAGNIDIVSAHQLTPELAETISESGLAVFIDACCDRGAGLVYRTRVIPATGSLADRMTHRLDPSVLLGYAKSLYGAIPKALFYTIGGQTFEFGESISRPVRHAARFVIDDISRLVASYNLGVDYSFST